MTECYRRFMWCLQLFHQQAAFLKQLIRLYIFWNLDIEFPRGVIREKTAFKPQWNTSHLVMLTIHILVKLQDVDLNFKVINFLLTLNLGFLGIVQKLLTTELFYPRWWNTLLTTEKAASTQDIEDFLILQYPFAFSLLVILFIVLFW